MLLQLSFRAQKPSFSNFNLVYDNPVFLFQMQLKGKLITGLFLIRTFRTSVGYYRVTSCTVYEFTPTVSKIPNQTS